MSDRNDFLLKYFFIYGVSEEIKKELKINGYNEKNDINPEVLSSFSFDGNTQLFEVLKNKLNEDIYLKYNIFPIKADFLSEITFPQNPLDSPTFEKKSNPFNQYIDDSSSFDDMTMIQPFNHCFQYIFELDETKEDSIVLNFSVLIFF